jgi:hypothetical protein
MSSSAELHLSYRTGNAPIQTWPFPHFFVEGAFPDDFYSELRAKLPDPSEMRPIAEVRPVKGYKERFVLGFGDDELAALPPDKNRFWRELRSWLVGGMFANVVLNKFAHYLDLRFKDAPAPYFHDEALLVQDTTHYKLGPHSDAVQKVITLLFYLPGDRSQSHLGTSIYVPKDRAFRCPGGPHYPRELFDRVCTMPFVPNALFAFFKTDNSFHGVEPVADPDCRRWLLLYDIFLGRPGQRDAPPPAANSSIRFTF